MSKNKKFKGTENKHNNETRNLIYGSQNRPNEHLITNPHLQPKVIKAQALYYPNMVQVSTFNKPIIVKYKKTTQSSFPDDEDLEFIELEKQFNEIAEADISTPQSETDLERSIRRARKRIGDYTLCNSFDMFVTFTIRDDRQNSEKSKRKIKNWLNHQSSRHGKFRYIVVPEYHSDKQSLHFHALFGGYAGKISEAINPKTGKPLVQRGKKVYQVSGFTLGFTNVKLIGTSPEDATRISAYIKKYITKDMPYFENQQRYWASKGLKKPLIENNPEPWYQHIEPDWWCETPNGTITRFGLNKNALVDMFWEENGHAKS